MLNLHQCSSRKIKKSNDQTSLDFSLVALIFLLIPNASFSQPVIQATDPSQQLTPNTVKSPASVSHYKSPASSIDAAQLAQESIPSFALSSWVERAISQHPSVLQALAQEQALTQELESARWQYWPNVTVSADATKDGPGSTIGAEIPLWTAGRLGAQTDQARANLAAQTNAIQVARYSIAEQVVDAWALAAQSAGRVRVLDETLKTLSRYEAIMERRVSTEISPRVELDLLRARVGETQINRTNADNQGQIAVRRLKLLSDQYIAWDEWKKTSLLDQADHSLVPMKHPTKLSIQPCSKPPKKFRLRKPRKEYSKQHSGLRFLPAHKLRSDESCCKMCPMPILLCAMKRAMDYQSHL